MGFRWLAPAGLAAIALTLAACGSSSTGTGGSGGTSSSATATSGSTAAATAVVNSTKIGSATVLTDAKGFTLYWFAPDTSTTSNCNGSCASFWPPLKGPVTAGTGVTGTLGTITRSDGSTQATYNGHPLYTFVQDTAPGQDNGNGKNLSGGVWHDATVSGSAAPASSPSSGGGGGGYGY
jgi:predicted lipoprotein with Yx(FWY)xxD motif